MRSLVHLGFLSLAALLLSSCLPEERIWWSPKGDRAMVLIEEQLRVVGADGSPGTPFTDDLAQGQAKVNSVSWLPDGSGFAYHRTRLIATWDEVQKLVSADEVDSVEKMSAAVIPLLEAEVKLAGRTKDGHSAVSSLPVKERKLFEIALRRIYQKETVTVETLLKALPHGQDVVDSVKDNENGFEVNELCVGKLDASGQIRPLSLVRSMLRPPLFPRVSPKHDAVAFLRANEDTETATLEVMTLDGRSHLTVARNVAAAFDWTPDGRALVFMAPIGGEGEKLQGIHRSIVVQESGKLVKPRHEKQEDGSFAEVKGTDRLAEPATLATAITLNRPALQVLADGRVLFASSPMTLPVVGTGPELEGRLYAISADGKAVQAVPTAPGDLPTNLAYFVAAPDGKRVAVVEAETDAVAVVELDTGKTQIISPPHPRWQCRTLPAWKSSSELTFAGLPKGASRPAWLLWSEDKGIQNLSEKWPADATKDWLEQKSEEAPQESVISKPAPTR